jgi:hypothetical protein
MVNYLSKKKEWENEPILKYFDLVQDQQRKLYSRKTRSQYIFIVASVACSIGTSVITCYPINFYFQNQFWWFSWISNDKKIWCSMPPTL